MDEIDILLHKEVHLTELIVPPMQSTSESSPHPFILPRSMPAYSSQIDFEYLLEPLSVDMSTDRNIPVETHLTAFGYGNQSSDLTASRIHSDLTAFSNFDFQTHQNYEINREQLNRMKYALNF